MLPRTAVSSLSRRIVARLAAVGGAAAIAVAALSGSPDPDGLTVIVDVRPAGPGVRAVRVDVASGDLGLGAVERRFGADDARPIRVDTAAATGPIEIAIELDTAHGPRRARRVVTAAPGSTVTISVDALAPSP